MRYLTFKNLPLNVMSHSKKQRIQRLKLIQRLQSWSCSCYEQLTWASNAFYHRLWAMINITAVMSIGIGH